MYYRPRNFGEVFGLQLPEHIPFWVYPWASGNYIDPDNGWLQEIDEVPRGRAGAEPELHARFDLLQRARGRLPLECFHVHR